MVDLDGNYDFDAPPEMLWEMVLDPDILARILPGCDNLVIVDENKYEGQMKIKIGPVDGVFRGNVVLSDLEPLQSFHLVVNGRGPSGIVKGEGDVRLEGNQNGTHFIYSGSGQVSGRMATVGQRVMSSSAKAVVKQSLQNLENQVEARLQPVRETAAGLAEGSAGDAERVVSGQAPPAPSQTEFMLGVAENMIEEFIPNPQHRRAVVGLALVSTLIFLTNIFANMVARRVVKMIKEDPSS